MYKSKKQLKQKIEELEKENRILRQTLEKYTKETIIDYESEEYKIMCEEYKKIEKEYDSYYED